MTERTRTFENRLFRPSLEQAVYDPVQLEQQFQRRLKRTAEEIALHMLASGMFRLEKEPATSDAESWRLSITVQF